MEPSSPISSSKSSSSFLDLPSENLVLKILQQSFDESQQQRYDSFKLSKFDINKIKKIINNCLGNVQVNELNLQIIKTAAKVYLGDLIEQAIEIQGKKKGGLEVKHLRESYRIMQENQNANYSKGGLEDTFLF